MTFMVPKSVIVVSVSCMLLSDFLVSLVGE